MTPLDIQPWLLWTLIGIGLLILEVITPGFLVACFGVGALIAAIPAALGLSAIWQMIAFVIGSALALYFVRPIIRRTYTKHEPIRTGADALLGRKLTLKHAVPAEGYAELAIDGDVWRVCSAQGTTLEAGQAVRIVRRDSLILYLQATN